MRVLLASAALVASLSAGAGAQTVVLADGRSSDAGTDASAWSARASVQQAVGSAGTYWRDRSTDYEEDVLVMDVTEGAFTRAGSRQQAVLYMMSPWPRCCPKMGVAFIEDEQVLLNVAFEETDQTLDAVPDLNGDGRDELVFTGEFGMGGQVSRSMILTTFGPDGIEDLTRESILESSCGAGAGGGESQATRVLGSPGPALTVEHFTQSCDGGPWRSAGAAEPLVLEPMLDHRYVEVPLARNVTVPPDATSGGRSETGRLEPGDRTLSSGEFVDQFELECRAGRPLVLDLRATDFDPYLIFRPPVGDQVDNDDHEGDRTHSRIEATPAQNGACNALVTSYQPGETGAYELVIEGGD